MKRLQKQRLDTTLKRQKLLLFSVFFGFFVLGVKIVSIEVTDIEKLQSAADQRHVRHVAIAPLRGAIVDRNEQMLAVSTPVDTLAADARQFCLARTDWQSMMPFLSVSAKSLEKRCQKLAARNYKTHYMFIERQLPPAQAEKVLELDIPGVFSERRYKRFYPTGPAAAHLIGFTNIDGLGQEGLEKQFDQQLTGDAGQKVVLRDNKGRFVEHVDQIKAVRDGEPLQLSLDSRLQYLASAYLQEAVRQHQADAGGAVVLKIPTGEVLAYAGAPQFNPNDRSTLLPDNFRNRIALDLQEPGSTIKPFTIAMALESGRYSSGSTVDTGKWGKYRIGGSTISDTHGGGVITLKDVVVESSNIGSAKIALDFPAKQLNSTLKKAGFGEKVGLLPREATGSVPLRQRPIEIATQSYGYGLNATLLQLARAYTVFANDGKLLPLTLFPVQDGKNIDGERVFSSQTTASVLEMLEGVVSTKGTARRAKVDRYRVGGKTGTTHKLIDGSYAEKRYVSWFVGLAPISDPQFVIAVMVDDPRGEDYYGGAVAAPVFAKIMKDALRIYNVEPDGADILDASSQASASKGVDS